MPTALMTRSTVISWLLPPDVMVAVTLVVGLLQAADRGRRFRIFMPCFSKARLAKAEPSSSSTGQDAV